MFVHFQQIKTLVNYFLPLTHPLLYQCICQTCCLFSKYSPSQLSELTWFHILSVFIVMRKFIIPSPHCHFHNLNHNHWCCYYDHKHHTPGEVYNWGWRNRWKYKIWCVPMVLILCHWCIEQYNQCTPLDCSQYSAVCF